jgi:hypothetical protein
MNKAAQPVLGKFPIKFPWPFLTVHGSCDMGEKQVLANEKWEFRENN